MISELQKLRDEAKQDRDEMLMIRDEIVSYHNRLVLKIIRARHVMIYF